MIKGSTDVGAGAKKEAQNQASNITPHVTNVVPIPRVTIDARPCGHGYWVYLALDLVLSGTKLDSMVIFFADNA